MRRREIEIKPPRDQRIVIYCTEETKKRWKTLFVSMKVRNYEEALNRLLDLYEILSKAMKEKRLVDLVEKVEIHFGMGIQLKVIGKR